MNRELPQNSRPGAIIIFIGIITLTIVVVSMALASSTDTSLQSQNIPVEVDTANLLNSLGILAFGIIIASAARVLYTKIWRDQF